MNCLLLIEISRQIAINLRRIFILNTYSKCYEIIACTCIEKWFPFFAFNPLSSLVKIIKRERSIKRKRCGFRKFSAFIICRLHYNRKKCDRSFFSTLSLEKDYYKKIRFIRNDSLSLLEWQSISHANKSNFYINEREKNETYQLKSPLINKQINTQNKINHSF